MILPSGRMCSGPVMVDGKPTYTVYPAATETEALSILEEYHAYKAWKGTPTPETGVPVSVTPDELVEFPKTLQEV